MVPTYSGKMVYEYDFGDGWEIVVSRMADSKDDEIACVETVGTNAMEDIGGVGGLEEFTELLKNCKIEIFFIGMLDRYAVRA